MSLRFVWNNLTHALLGGIVTYIVGWQVLPILFVLYIVFFYLIGRVLEQYTLNKNYIIGCGINTVAMVSGGILVLILTQI